MEIPHDRVIYHRMRFHGKDPARGGLIRPIADKAGAVAGANDDDFDAALKNLAGGDLPGNSDGAEELMRDDMQHQFDEGKK